MKYLYFYFLKTCNLIFHFLKIYLIKKVKNILKNKICKMLFRVQFLLFLKNIIILILFIIFYYVFILKCIIIFFILKCIVIFFYL